ncbi:MAG: hypothetical protein GY941_16585 [Planctomycetes bacterium]|nr:hypothetical protein [Planctomycetota bacterium]
MMANTNSIHDTMPKRFLFELMGEPVRDLAKGEIIKTGNSNRKVIRVTGDSVTVRYIDPRRAT